MRVNIESTITAKGQITIPRRIREFLHVRPKDKIAFEIENEEVKIKPAMDVESAFGIIKPKQKPENFRAMRETVERAIAKETAKEA